LENAENLAEHEIFYLIPCNASCHPTAGDIVPEGVLPERDTRKWAGVDSAREQKKLEARKMLLNRAA